MRFVIAIIAFFILANSIDRSSIRFVQLFK